MAPPPKSADLPRKVPCQARSNETVRSILEAAARILESNGYGGYNTNTVAALAGVSPGSLYQYFPNKEAITRALIFRETSALLHDCSAAADATSGYEGMVRFVGAAVDHQLRRPVLARLLDCEEARMPEDYDLNRVSSQAQSILSDILSRSDLPPQADHCVAARDVIAVIKGMVDSAGASLEKDVEYLNARVLRAVFGYLRSA